MTSEEIIRRMHEIDQRYHRWQIALGVIGLASGVIVSFDVIIGPITLTTIWAAMLNGLSTSAAFSAALLRKGNIASGMAMSAMAQTIEAANAVFKTMDEGEHFMATGFPPEFDDILDEETRAKLDFIRGRRSLN